jgi:hypothetical protein
MRPILFLVLVAPATVRAELQATFHPRSSTYGATHIVLVKTDPDRAGRFRVVESWKGNRKKDETLRIPDLARDARGEMVLFLRHFPQHGGDSWRPASVFKDWRTSVAWLDGDTVLAVDQHELRTATVGPLSYVKSRKAFRDLIDFYLASERALSAARATEDVEKRVAALTAIVTGRLDLHEEAFAELGRCGPKAVPALRAILDGAPSHDQKYAVAALVTAGGREVVPDIARRIETEVAWWAKHGPKLKAGWWHDTSVEAWKRRGTLGALIDVYRTYPAAALEKQVLAVRDLMRNLPAADADRGIASLAAQCDRILAGDE